METMAIMSTGAHHPFAAMHSVADAKIGARQKPCAAALMPSQVPTKDHRSSEMAVGKDEHHRRPEGAGLEGHLAEFLIEEESPSAMFHLVFVYGTLKRGFWNHQAIQKQMAGNHCRLVGIARTRHRYPLVCGPFQVPFLLDKIGTGNYVRGELYQMDSHCLAAMDELEGTSKGHYTRSPMLVTGIELDPSFKASFQSSAGGQWLLERDAAVQAEGYFAGSKFTAGLLQAPHINAYTQKEHSTYVRRINRPPNRTFIEHVNCFIEEQGQSCSVGARV